MNAIMFQTASVVGPSLGGIVIAASSVGWVYIANTLSFGCVIAALVMMRGVSGKPVREAHDPEHEVSWRAAREGLHFVFRSPLIRSTMLLDFFATFFSSASALPPISRRTSSRRRLRLRGGGCSAGSGRGADGREMIPRRADQRRGLRFGPSAHGRRRRFLSAMFWPDVFPLR